MASPVLQSLLRDRLRSVCVRSWREDYAVEINDAMVQAATQVLWDSGYVGYVADGPDQLTVRDMLKAALAVEQESTSYVSPQTIRSNAARNPEALLPDSPRPLQAQESQGVVDGQTDE